MSWGWLSDGSFTPGVLDSATANAILSFQQYCVSELYKTLPEIDPQNPVIDSDTYALLMHDTGEVYSNPAVAAPQESEPYAEDDYSEDYDDYSGDDYDDYDDYDSEDYDDGEGDY